MAPSGAPTCRLRAWTAKKGDRRRYAQAGSFADRNGAHQIPKSGCATEWMVRTAVELLEDDGLGARCPHSRKGTNHARMEIEVLLRSPGCGAIGDAQQPGGRGIGAVGRAEYVAEHRERILTISCEIPPTGHRDHPLEAGLILQSCGQRSSLLDGGSAAAHGVVKASNECVQRSTLVHALKLAWRNRGWRW